MERGKKEFKNDIFGKDYKYFVMYKHVVGQQYMFFAEVTEEEKRDMIEEFKQLGTITKSSTFLGETTTQTIIPLSIMFAEKVEEYGYLDNPISLR